MTNWAWCICKCRHSKKKESELESHFDKWAYFLKNLENFEDIPQILNEAVFQQAFTVAELANMTKEQREDYEKSRLSYIGIRRVTETAEKEGVHKGKIEIAKKMKHKSLPLADISELTGLTMDEIAKL